jgi:integrase
MSSFRGQSPRRCLNCAWSPERCNLPRPYSSLRLGGHLGTFETVAREWLALQAKTDARSNRSALSRSTWDKALQIFERLIFPYIGSRPISTITVPELLRMLKRIEERGHHETCHRAKQRCGQIFRYAIVTGRAERDLTHCSAISCYSPAVTSAWAN